MKWIKRILISLLLLITIFVVFNFSTIKRLLKVSSLFKQEKIAQNFLTMEDFFPTTVIASSSSPIEYIKNDRTLPVSFDFQDTTWSIKDYIEYSQTAGLIIMKGDEILHEEYRLGLTEDEDFISWSVCKSIVSALVGIAIEKGLIKSIGESVDSYAPILKGSGYEGVSIKDVLQMSSGIKFNEDYADQQSDINKMGRVFAFGTSFDEYVSSLVRERAPGEYHKYVSMDTQVLGMVLTKATGMSLSKFCENELWSQIGTEFPALWLTDNDGMEAAFGGFNACLRDYAKFGKLYADNGVYKGKQIIDSTWISASTTATEEHLLPGDNPKSNSVLGYGYQWWIPEGENHIFTANGVYNQYIYVDPIEDIVIVKCSANYHYAEERKETIKRHFAFLNALRDNIVE